MCADVLRGYSRSNALKRVSSVVLYPIGNCFFKTRIMTIMAFLLVRLECLVPFYRTTCSLHLVPRANSRWSPRKGRTSSQIKQSHQHRRTSSQIKQSHQHRRTSSQIKQSNRHRRTSRQIKQNRDYKFKRLARLRVYTLHSMARLAAGNCTATVIQV